MPRLLRIYFLACVALSFLYLLVHAREPLRLNVGDPWTDASVMVAIDYAQHRGFSADPIVVRTARSSRFTRRTRRRSRSSFTRPWGWRSGSTTLRCLRVIALMFSAIALLRCSTGSPVWSDTVAVIATALFATSLLWMTFADSVHRPPIMHAACFVALWGVLRTIETGRARYYAVVFVATFTCLFTAFDLLVVLAGRDAVHHPHEARWPARPRQLAAPRDRHRCGPGRRAGLAAVRRGAVRMAGVADRSRIRSPRSRAASRCCSRRWSGFRWS